MTWSAAAFAVLALALAAGFGWYERSHPSSRVLALVATLAALAALGRVAFAPLPSVKPTTDIVLISGFMLGGAPGFFVGAVAALTSNLFFGQGPWTPAQMVAWGLVGVFGAMLGAASGRRLGRVRLAIACGVAALGFSLFMDVSEWLTFTPGSRGLLLATLVRGASFDAAHVIGSVAFALAFGPALVRILGRFRARFDVRWHPAGALLGVGLLVAALSLAGASGTARASGTPGARTSSEALARSIAYLRAAQNADGGFGAARGQSSSALYTAWAAMGLSAAGRPPGAVRRSGRSPLTYLERSASSMRSVGDIERTILALRAGGASAGALTSRLVAARAKDGSFSHLVNATAFAVLALRAAGRPPSDAIVRSAARWLARQENGDGGFNFAGRGGASGIDDTAAPVQALVAAGRRRSAAVRRAIAYLASQQRDDGGFPLSEGAPSNAQSTSWAIQAFVAAGRDPERVRRHGSRSAPAYLRSLVAGDGSVQYSRTSRQTPVWVTAQALTALAEKAFPLAPRPVRARRASAAPQPAAPVARSATAPTPRSAAPRRRSIGLVGLSRILQLAGMSCARTLNVALVK